MEIGTIVTYDDENPDETMYIGTVVAPTREDLGSTSLLDDIGADFGDVMVEWREEGTVYNRSWEHPSYLTVIERNRESV